MRFLLKQPPACSCSDCTSRYRRLVPESVDAAEAAAADAAEAQQQSQQAGAAGGAVPELWRSVEAALRAGAASTVGRHRTAVGFGGGNCRIAVAAELTGE
eukprot:SAG22_NODE_383_length_11344_cov_6.163895_2_plen_100_part_00